MVVPTADVENDIGSGRLVILGEVDLDPPDVRHDDSFRADCYCAGRSSVMTLHVRHQTDCAFVEPRSRGVRPSPARQRAGCAHGERSVDGI
jgi:hypothetical protein